MKRRQKGRERPRQRGSAEGRRRKRGTCERTGQLRDIPSDRESRRDGEATWETDEGGKETIKRTRNVCRGIEEEDKVDRRRKT